MKIRFNYDYPTLNQLISSAQKRKGKFSPYGIEKKQATNYTEMIVKEYIKENNTPIFENSVEIKCVWFRGNKRSDPDNISACIKYVIDGIVKGKLLKDDTMKYIHKISHEFEKSENGKNYVIVEVK